MENYPDQFKIVNWNSLDVTCKIEELFSPGAGLKFGPLPGVGFKFGLFKFGERFYLLSQPALFI